MQEKGNNPLKAFIKMAGTQGRHAREQSRAGMHKNGSNPGQACRKMAVYGFVAFLLPGIG